MRAYLMLAQMAEAVSDWEGEPARLRTGVEHEIRYATEVLPALARIVRRQWTGGHR